MKKRVTEYMIYNAYSDVCKALTARREVKGACILVLIHSPSPSRSFRCSTPFRWRFAAAGCISLSACTSVRSGMNGVVKCMLSSYCQSDVLCTHSPGHLSVYIHSSKARWLLSYTMGGIDIQVEHLARRSNILSYDVRKRRVISRHQDFRDIMLSTHQHLCMALKVPG